jgi:hypothetical protein
LNFGLGLPAANGRPVRYSQEALRFPFILGKSLLPEFSWISPAKLKNGTESGNNLPE